MIDCCVLFPGEIKLTNITKNHIRAMILMRYLARAEPPRAFGGPGGPVGGPGGPLGENDGPMGGPGGPGMPRYCLGT